MGGCCLEHQTHLSFWNCKRLFDVPKNIWMLEIIEQANGHKRNKSRVGAWINQRPIIFHSKSKSSASTIDQVFLHSIWFSLQSNLDYSIWSTVDGYCYIFLLSLFVFEKSKETNVAFPHDLFGPDGSHPTPKKQERPTSKVSEFNLYNYKKI